MTKELFERKSHAAATNDPPAQLQILSEVLFFQEGLARALERECSFVVAGAFVDLRGALSGAAAARPDAVLLDAAFPDGYSAVKLIREAGCGTRVIALAVKEIPEEVVAWAEAGVAGYIPGTASLTELSTRLVDILRGKQACTSEVASALLERLATPRPREANLCERSTTPTLTSRENEIAEMIVSGLTNKDIARRLGIGVATTKTHVHHLLAKLNLQRRGQAAHWMRERRDIHRCASEKGIPQPATDFRAFEAKNSQ